MRRTSDDVKTLLSRGFTTLSAGGNLDEPHPRPSASRLVSAGLSGEGVKRACENRLDLERDEIGPGSAPVNDSEPALQDT